MPILLKLLLRRLHKPEDGGEFSSTGAASPAPAPTLDVSAAPAAPAAPAGPTTMLEAIDQGLAAKAAPAADPLATAAPALAGQPRDELGRFTFKNDAGQAVDANGVPAPDQAAALAAQAAAAAPAVAEDPTKMPEGLGPKAQERFQTLANSNKELTAKVEHFETKIMPAVQAMQETWTENQVQPEQFQQAMAVVGMMNRGDFAGAQAALMQQLQVLAAHTGQTLQVDPLQAHPDLLEQVNTLQMSREAAATVAQARVTQQMHQQGQQRQNQQLEQQRQQQEQEQQFQQQRGQAQADVNTFCLQMKKTDLDYSAIEEQLLPAIPELLQDVPPQRWAAVVQRQYQLIKSAVGSVRRTPTQPGMQPLRPTGQGGGTPQPKTMAQAMWGANFSA